MKKSLLSILFLILLIALIYPAQANAQGACASFAWEQPDLVGYIKCVKLNLLLTIQLIAAVAAFIMTIFLIFHTARNLDNPKELSNIGMRWLYLFIFVIIVATAGRAIFIPLTSLGFEGGDYWIDQVDLFLDRLDSGSAIPPGNNSGQNPNPNQPALPPVN